MEIKWKIIAIVFMVLFFSTWAFISWGLWLNNRDLKQQNICYWDICGDYPEAEIVDNVCHCYDYDLLGDYVHAKSTYLG